MKFEDISYKSLLKLVMVFKPTTCSPLPASLYKDFWPVLEPTMLNVNLSLSSGIVPASFKAGLVKPLLKKSHFEPESLNNYRPVSKLLFLS